jgi:hypothetical protein
MGFVLGLGILHPQDHKHSDHFLCGSISLVAPSSLFTTASGCSDWILGKVSSLCIFKPFCFPAFPGILLDVVML